jgi:hypothetical protein
MNYCEILVYCEPDSPRMEECGEAATAKTHGHWVCERHHDLILSMEDRGVAYRIAEQFEYPEDGSEY